MTSLNPKTGAHRQEGGGGVQVQIGFEQSVSSSSTPPACPCDPPSRSAAPTARTSPQPSYTALPLDRCTQFVGSPWSEADSCGEPAASAWCRLQGLRRAAEIGALRARRRHQLRRPDLQMRGLRLHNI